MTVPSSANDPAHDVSEPRNGRIWVVAVFFAGMGLIALLDPHWIPALYDIDVRSMGGRNEVRAVYGGFGLAMAGALVAATRVPAWRSGVLLCLALALGGMAAGRLVSFLVDQQVGAVTTLTAAGELLLAGLLLSATRAKRP